MTIAQAKPGDSAPTPFQGLAPYLRMNIGGVDLRPVGQTLLEQVQLHPDDANLWMNLATVMLCIGQHDVGMAMQSHALEMQRVFRLAAAWQPARLRLLLLAVPGDLAANAPLDCLLEGTDIEIDFYYVTPGEPLARPVPEHDAVFVAISESDANRDTLNALAQALARWPKPVINAPQHIPATNRQTASELLRDAPGLSIPPTRRASRAQLDAVATGNARLADLFGSCDFPVILRPLDSHAGRDLERIAAAADVAAYLSRVGGDEFFVSPFIDYSGEDGLFRKYRVALIDGAAYACHMGISAHWMIHYVNAGMYEDAGKRAEEARFMEHFDDFERRHHEALAAIHQRSQLDYVCIDCGETRDGRLLIFEIDHAMVVHAMDPDELFPYKRVQMRKVRDAFRDFLLRRA